MLHQEFHHALHIPAFLGAREQLTIAECTGSSFAEAVVRLGIQAFVAIQQRNIFLAFAYLFPPLVDDGFDAVLDER